MVQKFKFWCQKVLPLVYDDSLSYYEVLNKLTNKINEMIEYINGGISDAIKKYIKDYVSQLVILYDYDATNLRITFDVHGVDEDDGCDKHVYLNSSETIKIIEGSCKCGE